MASNNKKRLQCLALVIGIVVLMPFWRWLK
jgi:hypothetical protein